MRWTALKLSMFVFLLFAPVAVLAQGQSAPPAASDEQLLKPEELEALVAPIALYPDTLLAQILMASTYPLEVVQAERWANENKNLKDDQLKAAVDKQAWDETVKALVATPDVLKMMSSKLDWTEKLGDAVLAQQPDVMDAIQRLRSKAQANNKLSSTKEQKVSVKQEQNKQVIVIEPTNPDTIYVPYYDPKVVYGGWSYPSYPPYYFGYPGYIPGAVIGAGLAFGAGYALGRWATGGNYWGGSVNWNNNNINVNRPVNINNVGNNWQHNAAHRQGVRYNNPQVEQRFGNNNLRNGSQARMDFRGRSGEQVLRPGGGQANLGGAGRPGVGGGGAGVPGAGGGANRPSVGGGANRPSGGGGANRPSAGGGANRPSAGGGGPGAGGRGPGVATRPAGGGGGNALGNIQSGRATNLQSQRGRASVGGGGGGARVGGGGGGGRVAGGGGGGARAGGGGGRRSDIRLKHDVVLIGHLDNGLGFYRFAYNGSEKAYVGVLAQEVQSVEPDAVVVGRDGYLRVFYDKLGLKLQTYEQWIASGAQIPSAAQVQH
jgi:hypothetical protein